MSLDNLLRDNARQDLKRFTPDAHYAMGRDHKPIADRELVKPLLFEPVRFGLTPREGVAATALDSLATYEIESRAIFDRANPARDWDDTTKPPGMTFDDERQIWGRWECFRDSALRYARMLRDEQLIERYQTPTIPPVESDSTTHSHEPLVAVGALGVPDQDGPGWSLKTSIKRAPGYRWPLFQTLKAAHVAGKPCPKARDVLDTWTMKPPPDVQVMPDGVKYNDGLGKPKEANLKAIQQAIKNLLE